MAMSVRRIQSLYQDPIACARYLRLRYVTDFGRGYRQEKKGRGLAFYAPNGRQVTNPQTVDSLKKLRVPPAWKEVWISPSDRTHILAIGTDELGRKQYRYHPKWQSFRTLLNAYRMIPFGYALSRIRSKTAMIDKNPDVNEETALLAAIRLLDETLIRIGMPTEETDAVGLLTLEDEHVDVGRTTMTLSFTGKSGQDHEIEVDDKPLVKFMSALVTTGDDELFSYTNEDGEVETISAEDLNGKLRELGGSDDISAKEFRTWGGTLAAFEHLAKHPAETAKDRKAHVVEAVTKASERLGNTPAIAKKSYVHPHIIETYEQGVLHDTVRRIRIRKAIPNLYKNEQRLLHYLERLLAQQATFL